MKSPTAPWPSWALNEAVGTPNASDSPRRALWVPAEGLRLGGLAGFRPVSVTASDGPGFGRRVLGVLGSGLWPLPAAWLASPRCSGRPWGLGLGCCGLAALVRAGGARLCWRLPALVCAFLPSFLGRCRVLVSGPSGRLAGLAPWFWSPLGFGFGVLWAGRPRPRGWSSAVLAAPRSVPGPSLIEPFIL